MKQVLLNYAALNIIENTYIFPVNEHLKTIVCMAIFINIFTVLATCFGFIYLAIYLYFPVSHLQANII